MFGCSLMRLDVLDRPGEESQQVPTETAARRHLPMEERRQRADREPPKRALLWIDLVPQEVPLR